LPLFIQDLAAVPESAAHPIFSAIEVIAAHFDS